MLQDEQRHTFFELISTDMYYIRAKELNCKIHSFVIDETERTSVKIIPFELESVELNNRKLSARGCISEGREYIEKRRNIPKEEVNGLFSEFRGVIFGYPYYQLVINLPDEKDTITCDIVRIKGGFQNTLPWVGYAKFSVDFLELEKNGEIRLIKSFSASDAGKKFSIRKSEKVGQIISPFPDFPWGISYLNPSDLVDFINGVRTSYMGSPSHPWTELKGNIITDSIINYLNIEISFKTRTITFYNRENLYEKTYEIISHSLMDPWNDECTENTDRYIWANISFNDNTLIELIKNLTKCGQVMSFDSKHVRFKNGIKKSEFEELTGIHLFESIIHTSSKY